MSQQNTGEQQERLLEKHAEYFKKIGFLFHLLVRIENKLDMNIEAFFGELNQTKNSIFNQALLDEKIFPTLENKRRFLLKIIVHLAEKAKRDGLIFDEARYHKFCRTLLDVQKTRNKLAHRFLSFSEGSASYLIRKDFIHFERKEIKLDIEIEKAEQVLEECHILLTKFLEEAFVIMHKGESTCCVWEALSNRE